MKREDEIAMVRRHVQQGERHVARQRQIVDTLKAAGSETLVADTLLAQYEAALGAHQAHLRRLQGR